MDTYWAEEAALMRCVNCSAALKPDGEALRCTGCSAAFPVRDGILDVGQPDEGNNKVAAEFYDGPRWQRFKFWEQLFFLLHGGERRARRQFMRYAPPLSGTRLIVVAIGEGNDLEFVPRDCTVSGLDISTVQLRDCRRRYADRNLRLILGEAERLPYRDHAFDHALSAGGFNLFSDPLGSLKEMARVVKPGGTILISDEVPEMGEKATRGPLRRMLMRRSLGDDFLEVIKAQSGLQLEPMVRQVLRNGAIHPIWRGKGYCIVGQSPGGEG
jgi:ubiquinone/menaquinone biosynthesis C-methylase UbiE